MNGPHPYDLTKKSEQNRLILEVTEYMRVSLRDGTDFAGRRFAWEALNGLATRVRAKTSEVRTVKITRRIWP